MRPAGDRAGPADLPGRPDVDRAALARGARRRRDRGVPAARRARRLDRGVHRADRRGASGGRRSSTPPRSTWCRSTARRRSTRRGPCCGPLMCAAGPEQMLADASFAVAQEPPWSPWRDTALVLVRRGAPAHRRRRPGRGRCSPRRPRWPPRWPTPTRSSTARPSSRCWRWIADGGTEAAEHVERGARRRSTSTGCTTTPTSVLAFAGAARLARAPRRPDGGEPPAHAGDAGPPVAARSCCRISPCGCGCSSPRCTGRSATTTTARHLLREIDDVLLHRPALGALVDEVVGASRSVIAVERAGGSGGRVAAHARRSCGCSRTCRRTSRSARSPSGCSCPATRSAPRSARSTASSASRHATKPCNGRRRSACSAGRPTSRRRIGVRRRRRCRSRAPSPASGRPRRRGAARRRERRRPARRRSRRSSPRRSPRRRPAPRRTGRRHRPRPTRRGGRAPASSDRASPDPHRPRRVVVGDAGIVDRQTAQPIRVVHGRVTSSCRCAQREPRRRPAADRSAEPIQLCDLDRTCILGASRCIARITQIA